MTAHHLIPKTLHGNKWFRKNFTRAELLRAILICRDCHDAVHKFLDAKTLGRHYNSVEKILTNAQFARYVAWVREGGRP